MWFRWIVCRSNHFPKRLVTKITTHFVPPFSINYFFILTFIILLIHPIRFCYNFTIRQGILKVGTSSIRNDSVA